MSFNSLEKGKVDDLVLLDDISENGIVANLRARFNNDLIYTSIGPVLITVNPFKTISGMYSPGMIKAYNGKYSYEVAPHINGPAEETFRSLLSSGRNQCILVSGESGAGKTEACKKILEYISAVSNDSHAGKSVSAIKDKLLESNPIMEAFGNAKTLRNDNSSRFGKYMVIQFDFSGAPLGATIQQYLLEKPRVVKQQEGERNFHIFYNLCAGASGSLRSELGLGKASDYEYTKTTISVKTINDEAEFQEVDSALDIIVGGERRKHLYHVVAGVLHLGNITFRQSGDHCDAANCDQAAKCLSVDSKTLGRAVTYRTIRTRGETVSTPLKIDECQKTRDALAKAVYQRAFKQLVGFLNESLNAKERVELNLGLLDIFGFEIFQRNSFEQLLINYTNERLQQIFVKLTLESEQREYAAEGIKWQEIPYFNNQIVCDLIDSKKPAGIIAYCDEEAIMPSATDKSLLNKLNTNLGSHKHFGNLAKDSKRGDTTEFCVKHYAGDVVYSTEGFIEKNVDTLYRDLIELVGSSRSPMMAVLFPESKEAHDGKKPITAGSQFRIDMQDLMDTLMKCDPHYVRCIKPNDNKQSGVFDEARVAHQVRYLGLLENVRVRRAGFAYRHTYPLFVHRYKMVCPSIWLKFPPSNNARQDAKAILDSMAITGEGDAFAMGKTKIFIRRPETLFSLEEMRERKMHDVVRMIQTAWRLYQARLHFLELREKSMGIFKGRKRRRGSWVLFFQGDYIHARDSMELRALFAHPKIGANDQKIVFADQCDVLAKKNKLEQRYVIFTEKSLYIADLQWKQPRRLDLRNILKWSLSTYADGFIVLKVPEGTKPPEPDLVIQSVRKAEIVTVLSEQRGQLPLEFSDTIDFKFLKKGLFSSKIVQGRLNFTERNIAGHAFFELGPTNPPKLDDLTVAVCPQMGSKAQVQLTDKTQERAIATLAGRAAQGFVDHTNKAQDLRKNRGGPSSPTDFSTSSAPLPNTAGLKQAKVLYDYKGNNSRDLNVTKGESVNVIVEHNDGWFDCQKGNQRGLVPGAYLQVM